MPRIVKTLFLVRHAKSSWENPEGGDHARTLNDRGRKNAPEMAARLKGRAVTLDRLITSSATRARETGAFFVSGLDLGAESVIVEAQLYGATAADWLGLIQSLDESWNSVMMIGHNPTLTELANGLGRMDISNVPTCGVLECRYAGDYWGNFGEQAEDLEIDFDYPKNMSA